MQREIVNFWLFRALSTTRRAFAPREHRNCCARINESWLEDPHTVFLNAPSIRFRVLKISRLVCYWSIGMTSTIWANGSGQITEITRPPRFYLAVQHIICICMWGYFHDCGIMAEFIGVLQRTVLPTLYIWYVHYFSRWFILIANCNV